MTDLWTVSDTDRTVVPWEALTPERQKQIAAQLREELGREREELRYLRILLLSNGGRSSQEIVELIGRG